MTKITRTERDEMSTEFREFQKIVRLKRGMVVTEKIDGTNGCIYIGDDGEFLVGSRTQWITPEKDNFGFARWAYANESALRELGPGRHYGEWWGGGIQRTYGLRLEKRFSLFNTARWKDGHPDCVSVVPVLFEGDFSTETIDRILAKLAEIGSVAEPGFMRPEGVVVYHTLSGTLFKKTIEKDDSGKGYGA